MPLQSAFAFNANEIYTTIGNMIISQEVFADNFTNHQTLVDKARVDGGLFGDSKLYYSVDALETKPWNGDSEAANLLSLDRAKDPLVQKIVLDKFRQIRLTIDNYLTKRAWENEGAFSMFTGVILQQMGEAKKIYDGTLYNAFIGATSTSTGKQIVSVDLGTGSGHPLYNLSGVEKEQMEAMLIAQALADLFVDMGDYTRSYNDNQYLRSYANESIEIVWNSKFVNKIRKVDLPTIFHKEGLVDKFEQDQLPARYFGDVITSSNISTYSASTPAAGKPIDSDDGSYVPGSNHANGCLRSMVEKDVTVSSTAYHVRPGDEIPSGATVKSGGTFELGEVYIEKDDIICKVMVKLPPFMGAFEVGTTFFNPRSLTENHYLTYGHNTLQYLKNYPFITVKKA